MIPVTLFLVVLYNACFMFQENNDTNLLITALDTFDLGADVGPDKFVTTFSESRLPNYSIQEKFAIQLIITSVYVIHKMNFRGLLSTQQKLYQTPPLARKMQLAKIKEGIQDCLST